MSDILADMITRIRNGQKSRKKSVKIKFSNLNKNVGDVLVSEGYLDSCSVITDENNNKKDIEVTLRYNAGSPLIQKIEKISKQGRRYYSGSKVIPKTIGGLGTTIVSTSKGVMTDLEARKQNIGGEVLISVF